MKLKYKWGRWKFIKTMMIGGKSVMQVNELRIKYPEELLFTLKESKEEFEKEMKFLLALKLYEIGKISSGNAAKLAGISRKEFILSCGKYKVSIFTDDLDDLKDEFKKENEYP